MTTNFTQKVQPKTDSVKVKNYHVVLSRPFDMEQIALDAQAQKRPRHTLWALSQMLSATIHQPQGYSVSLTDKILSKITGASQPHHWAMARTLSKQLTSKDTVFCIGEDSGFPIAALCGGKPNSPKLAVFVHNIDRPRGRLTLKLFDLRNRIDLFMTNTAVKADFLRQYINLPPEQVCLVTEQTDTRFFTPGLASPDKQRPIVGSGGLEQRDYRTFAEAIGLLDVDAKVCAVSPNAKKMADTFPEVMPENMSVKFYNWPDLVQLYRDSDVVVISLKAHNYQAGLTTLFESMSCRRPVIMTRTPGLVTELIDAGIVRGVEPADPEGMREAILDLLNNPEKAEEQAQRGYELVNREYNSEQYVEYIAAKVRSL
ncbi:MAG: glycosyltransferase family 4 protein [Geitlerinemataceae cyanobacterium]